MKKVFTILLICFSCIYLNAQTTTIQIPVATGADDADEVVEDNLLVNTGDMKLDNDELEMIYDDNLLRLCHVKVGIRFANITVPQGATIYNAYIQFTCKQTGSDVVNLTFHGQNSNNPAPFTDGSGNISARPLTTASVNWVPLGWYTADEAGTDQRTPSLIPVVQEIVNRSGWVSGNSMVFVVSGSGNSRAAYAYDGDPSKSAVLYIQYSPVGITENEQSINAVIQPNPASDLFTLSINEKYSNNAEFKLFNQLGSEVNNYSYTSDKDGKFLFNIPELPSGIYILSIRTGQSVTSRKIIIY